MKLSALFKKSSPKVIGRHVKVNLPELGLTNVSAKVDTGAYSGALHAEKVQPVSQPDSSVHLRFVIGKGKHRKPVEMAEFHTRKVTSSSGHMSERYAINTVVEIRGESYPITLTLTDRSGLRRPMLIGRNFLRTHGYLVDVTQFNK